MRLAIAPDYNICRNGRVWSSFRKKYLRHSDDGNGYRIIRLKTINGPKMFRVHRLVALAYLPNEMMLKEVNHKDGNKTNNHVNNLEWINHQANIYHFYNSSDPQTRFNKYVEDGLDIEIALYTLC